MFSACNLKNEVSPTTIVKSASMKTIQGRGIRNENFVNTAKCLITTFFIVNPALGGVNIKELLDDAAGEVGGKLLLDFKDTMGDRIQVFLE